MLKTTQYKFLSMPLWRKILFFTAILTFVYIDVKLNKGFNLTLLEFIVMHFNDPKTIDYFYLMLMMIISADIYNGAQNPYEDMIVLKVGGKKKWFIKICIYTVLVSYGIICIYLVLTYIIGFLGGFSGVFLNSQFAELYGLSKFQIIGQIILLSGLRILFLNMLIMCINLVCMNNPMGFIAVFMISMVDMFAYETFDIMEPWGILPLEHTRIIYTEAVAPPIDRFVRFPMGYSVLYWLIGILIVTVISYLIVLRKDFFTKCVKY